MSSNLQRVLCDLVVGVRQAIANGTYERNCLVGDLDDGDPIRVQGLWAIGFSLDRKAFISGIVATELLGEHDEARLYSKLFKAGKDLPEPSPRVLEHVRDPDDFLQFMPNVGPAWYALGGLTVCVNEQSGEECIILWVPNWVPEEVLMAVFYELAARAGS